MRSADAVRQWSLGGAVDGWVIAHRLRPGVLRALVHLAALASRRQVTPRCERPPPPPGANSAALRATAGTPGSPAGRRGTGSRDRGRSHPRGLDLQPGERAAFFGDPASPARGSCEIARAPTVFDITRRYPRPLGPFDAVLFESLTDGGSLTAAAPRLVRSLRADGRVVVVGRSSAALFEADAATQTTGPSGPSLVNALLAGAGLSPQEPPARSADDPADWMAGFMKPAPVGKDR